MASISDTFINNNLLRILILSPLLEGEIQDGEQTAQSLICNDCQKLFRDGKALTGKPRYIQHIDQLNGFPFISFI
jgi:hypothetical protein